MFGLIEFIGGKIFGIADKLIPDKDKQIEFKHEVDKLLLKAQNNQTMINMKEAEHASLFIAGWRPAIGWCGAIGLFYNYIIHPLIVWATAVWAPEVLAPPALLIGPLIGLVTSMLGFGGLRTFEKLKGVARRKTS